MTKIVTDLNQLKKKSKEISLNEAHELSIFVKLDGALKLSYRPGVGLAAIQIAIPVRAIIIRYANTSVNMLNPIIVDRIGKIRTQEGCLSLPGLLVETERAEQVMVRWIDYDSKTEQTAVFYGLEAVIVQHEVDHLDGILIIDREAFEVKKVGRNEPCPCGSGKKYKKCCGR